MVELTDMTAGRRIRHPTLGGGCVVGTGGFGEDVRLVVNFYVGGQKTLLWAFAHGKIELDDDALPESVLDAW